MIRRLKLASAYVIEPLILLPLLILFGIRLIGVGIRYFGNAWIKAIDDAVAGQPWADWLFDKAEAFDRWADGKPATQVGKRRRP